MRRFLFGSFAVCLALAAPLGATPSTEAINNTLAAVSAVQLDIAMTQKRFSIMSRGMAEAEKCAARELLDTSIGFRTVTDEVTIVGKLISEMKIADDQDTIRRHVGDIAHYVVAVGENDIQLVNDLMARLTTPDAIAVATLLRNKMIEVKGLVKSIANDKL